MNLRSLLWGFATDHPSLSMMHLVMFASVPLRDIVLPSQYTRLLGVVQHKEKGWRKFLVVLCVVAVTITCIQTLDFAGDYVDTKLLPALQAYVREKGVSAVLNKYESMMMTDIETGQIVTQLIRLPSVVTSLFERASIFLLPHFILHFCVLLHLACFVDVFLAAYVGITMIAIYTVSFLTPIRCGEVAMRRDRAFTEMYEEIEDTMRNLYSIYDANNKSGELSRVREVSRPYDAWYARSMMSAFRYRVLTYPVLTVFIATFMMRLYYLSCSSVKVAPVFLTGMILCSSFMNMDDQLKGIVQEWGILNSTVQSINEKAAAASSISSSSSVTYDIPDAPGIGLIDAHYAYPGASVSVVKGVTCHVQPGDIVWLEGQIGSGKTTVLKLLMGFVKPTRGVCYMHTSSNEVAFVPQSPVLFNRTVLDNLMYGNTGVSLQEAMDFLSHTGLHDIFSDKLHRKIGKNGSALSGGQRQLLWCARVLLARPSVILMDEPTSSMDNASKLLLIRLLRATHRPDRVVMMVSHDNDMGAAIATRVITMEDGVIVKERRL